MGSAGGWRGTVARWAVVASVKSLQLSHPTRFFGGIDSSSRVIGALKNVGHRVSWSTIARILKAHGIPPVPARPTSWQTLLRAHWGAISGADFFTTEVWTWRGLVTYYTVFVIDLASRRVRWRSAAGRSLAL